MKSEYSNFLCVIFSLITALLLCYSYRLAVAESISNKDNKTSQRLPITALLQHPWIEIYNDTFKVVSSALPETITSSRELESANNALQVLQTLVSENRKYGVKGLPEMSLELISRAEILAKSENMDLVKRVLNSALALSPESSVVLLSISRFVTIFGLYNSNKTFINGIYFSFFEPVRFVRTILFFFLLILVSFILSLIVVCCTQIIINYDSILKSIPSFVPKLTKSASISVLLFGILLPTLLPDGLLITLLSSSFILSVFLPDRKIYHWLALCCFCLFICVFNVACRFSAIPEKDLLVLESLSLSHLAPDYLNSLQNITAGNNDFTSHFGRSVLGYLLLNFNQISEAQEVISGAILEKNNKFLPLDAITSNCINKGASYLAQKKFETASTFFNEAAKMGAHSYELFFNLGQLALVSVDMDKHRYNIGQAKRLDPERFEDFEMGRDTGQNWVNKAISSISIYSHLFNNLWNSDVNNENFEKSFSLYKPVSFLSVLIVDLILFFACQFAIRPKKGNFSTPIGLWLILPLGYQIASSKVFQAIFGLSAIIALFWWKLELGCVFLKGKDSSISDLGGGYITEASALFIYCFFGIIGVLTYLSDRRQNVTRDVKQC